MATDYAAADGFHREPTKTQQSHTATLIRSSPQLTSAGHLGPSHLPRCLHLPTVASIDASSDVTDLRGTDSGYATAESAGSTPEKGTLAKIEDKHNSELYKLPQRGLFKGKSQQIRPYDIQLPLWTHERFKDLCELLGGPLHEYLAKAREKNKCIAMNLKVLGETEENARPWIVVQCDAAILKKVKQFFQQQWVKSEYQPSDAKIDLPYFDIYYRGEAPQQYTASVHLDVHELPCSATTNRQTLCGRPVMVNYLNEFRAATVGGRITVINQEGMSESYGLTAGHILHYSHSTEDGSCTTEDEEVDEHAGAGEDEEDSTSDVFELDLSSGEHWFLEEDLSCEEHPGWEDFTSLREPLKSVAKTTEHGVQRHSSPELWAKLGRVHTSCAAQGESPNLDWALIAVDEHYGTLPNETTALGLVHSLWSRFPEKETIDHQPSGRPVFVMNDHPAYSRPVGRLADLSSFLMLSPNKQFTQVYNLSFPNKTGLTPGDCGSWVIDSHTYEVFGHVVASDAFREAYVIPISATLKSIETQLGALEVFLPPTFEDAANMPAGSSGESLELEQLESPDQFKKYEELFLGRSPLDSGYASMKTSPGCRDQIAFTKNVFDYLLLDGGEEKYEEERKTDEGPLGLRPAMIGS